MPPCTCPSTSRGLICGPQSSTATYFTIVTWPVSRSTSTATMWAPNGNVKFFGSKKLEASRPGSKSAGRFLATYASEATSVQPTEAEPAENRPSANVTLPGSTCSRWAASRLALARILSTHMHDRRAAEDGGAAAVGVAPVVRHAGVAAQHHDVLHRHPEPVADDLGETGFLALPVRRRAGDDGDLAGELHPHAAPFPAAGGHRASTGRSRRSRRRSRRRCRPAARRGAPCRGRAAGRSSWRATWPSSARPGIVAAVVVEAGGGVIRELGGLGEVASSRRAIGSACSSSATTVDHPLDGVGGLGATGAAVGIGGHLVACTRAVTSMRSAANL